jgi:hypothetical protein
VTSPFERPEDHEQVSRTVALAFVIAPRQLPVVHQHRRRRFFGELRPTPTAIATRPTVKTPPMPAAARAQQIELG